MQSEPVAKLNMALEKMLQLQYNALVPSKSQFTKNQKSKIIHQLDKPNNWEN